MKLFSVAAIERVFSVNESFCQKSLSFFLSPVKDVLCLHLMHLPNVHSLRDTNLLTWKEKVNYCGKRHFCPLKSMKFKHFIIRITLYHFIGYWNSWKMLHEFYIWYVLFSLVKTWIKCRHGQQVCARPYYCKMLYSLSNRFPLDRTDQSIP